MRPNLTVRMQSGDESPHSKGRGRQAGQTIVVAIIILGLMLIMGFVFLGILNHSLGTGAYLRNRSQADDLSEAGIRYTHEQMLNSDLGADWRGQPTPMIDLNPNLGGGPGDPGNDTTVDPDAYFLRPPSTANGAVLPWPGTNQPDLGGPDGLGPYFRVNFQSGRALVRIRWSPSDPNIFNSNPQGALRTPGASRNYVILESVGREGVLTPNDPTIVQNNTRVRYRNFASAADFENSLSIMQGAQAKYGAVQVIRAFVPIGIIETARYITNKYHQSIAADIGVPSNMGATYRGATVAADLPTQMGANQTLLTFSNTGALAPSGTMLPVGGSLFSNADLMIHGQVTADLNFTLGDGWFVNGNMGGDGSLTVNESMWNGGSWATATPPVPTINSKNPSFSTLGGLVRDGSNSPDENGVPRGVGRKDPPSMEAVDPVTGENRYLAMTRDSGPLVGAGSNGRFGYGQGVYVNNFSDIQGGTNQTSRTNQGGAGSEVNDWLNPSTGSGSYWAGYLYNPPGAYVEILSDGFVITRNPAATATEQYWLNPDGSSPSSPISTLRFRLGRGSDGTLHVVNALTPNITNINGTLGATDFDNGPPFNGVLYFEGNVRIRGIIPTDIQLTMVSNATIYVEGSITKGLVGNQWTSTYPSQGPDTAVQIGATLTRPSKSMLMLMAKDYVCINTTQFWGPTVGQTITPKQDVSNLPSYNPIIMSATSGTPLSLQADFPFDPIGQPGDGTIPSNPSTWKPYVAGYIQAGTTNKIVTSALIAQTMDDGPGSSSFVEIDVNAGSPLPGGSTSPYLFSTVNPPYANIPASYGAYPNVAVQYESGNAIRDYGLGLQNYQRYGNFEQIALPLIDPNDLTAGTGYLTSTAAFGGYTIYDQSVNQIRLQPGSFVGQATNDYLLGRFAISPSDIRIEASMYAEEGSFFVIPGPWFNPNPNDTYANYLSEGGSQPAAGAPSAQLDEFRLQTYGSSPNTPFFGEPLDARIVISGAVSENMPPPASVQAEWQRKWGWIPEYLGATSQEVPQQHVPSGWTLGSNVTVNGNSTTVNWVPNIVIQYDPVLATGRRFGFVDPSSTGNLSDPSTYVRSEWIDYSMTGVLQPNEYIPLPPLPRLPVSPTLAYFGEVH